MSCGRCTFLLPSRQCRRHSRHPDFDAEVSFVFSRMDRIVNAALRRQTFAHPLEPEPHAARPRAIRIAGIVERSRQLLTVADRGEPDRSAFDELTDAVHDGVLD